LKRFSLEGVFPWRRDFLLSAEGFFLGERVLLLVKGFFLLERGFPPDQVGIFHKRKRDF